MKLRSIIITAGGTGKRMGISQPKQFLLLDGKPVLMHTIERLHNHTPESQFILTLPEDQIEEWKRLCEIHHFQLNIAVISGGKERYHSVKNAIEICTGEIIAVHDGVRPFVSVETLDRLFLAAEDRSAVIPVIGLKDSLRHISGDKSESVPRIDYKIVQTPQVFDAEILRKAYEQDYSHEFTDDASLVEANGIQIHLIEGNEDNIKITLPMDLKIAELLIAGTKEQNFKSI